MKVLLIRFSSLGDVILVSSVLSPLKDAGFRVDLLTYRPYGEIFRGDPRIQNVIQVEREKLRTLSAIRSLALKLSNYDLAVDLQVNLKSFVLSMFLKSDVLRYRKRAFLRRLMTVFKPFKAKWLRVPEMYAEPLSKIGINAEKPRPEVFVFPREKEEVKGFLPGFPFIAVAPGAKWEAKRYPIERFARIVSIVRKKGFSVVAVGDRRDEALGRFLRDFGAVNLCGKLTLREALAVIASAKGVISNDSAVVHMARAVKTPVVALFGPTHPALGFAPYPDEGAVITRNLPCSPCSVHGKTNCRERECMDIPPEEVAETFFHLLEEREGEGNI